MKTKMQNHPDYWLFHSMKKRCLNGNSRMYRYYGGRGIRVCERWQSPPYSGFANFLEDMGPRPDPSFTLDRINNDGDYEPSNCRWATRETQYENRSTTLWFKANGLRLTATQWAKKLGLAGGQTVSNRIRKGVSPEIALSARRLKRNPEIFKNAVEAAAKKRRAQTHCKRGHPLSGENLHIYVNKKGAKARVCKECKRLNNSGGILSPSRA